MIINLEKLASGLSVAHLMPDLADVQDLIGLRIPRPLGVVRGNRFYQIACSW